MNPLPLSLALYLLVLHYVADFLCQTEKDALSKHHDNGALTSHVIIYSGVLGLGIMMYPPIGEHSLGDMHMWRIWFAFVQVTFATHWITDFFTSRLNHRLWNRPGSKRLFWKAIGMDQLIHGLTLMATASWLLT